LIANSIVGGVEDNIESPGASRQDIDGDPTYQ
jgi:hypothetical protein